MTDGGKSLDSKLYTPNSKYIRSFGRRKGRGLTSEDADKLSNNEFIIQSSNNLIIQSSPTWLEIGSGSGENLIYQAEKNPDVILIGCEPYFNGVATTIKKAKEKRLQNVRLYAGDARELLENLPDNSIEKVFILYPDPWPKKRHNKRRIINAETLDMLARVIKSPSYRRKPVSSEVASALDSGMRRNDNKGGILRIATDHPDYAEWILLRVFENGKFKWTAEKADDFRLRPADSTTTKYEQKRLAGTPVYLEFVRE